MTGVVLKAQTRREVRLVLVAEALALGGLAAWATVFVPHAQREVGLQSSTIAIALVLAGVLAAVTMRAAAGIEDARRLPALLIGVLTLGAGVLSSTVGATTVGLLTSLAPVAVGARARRRPYAALRRRAAGHCRRGCRRRRAARDVGRRGRCGVPHGLRARRGRGARGGDPDPAPRRGRVTGARARGRAARGAVRRVDRPPARAGHASSTGPRCWRRTRRASKRSTASARRRRSSRRSSSSRACATT